jgi:hypothetical protein
MNFIKKETLKLIKNKEKWLRMFKKKDRNSMKKILRYIDNKIE